jgi:REP element-mobilizing transposase RayT
VGLVYHVINRGNNRAAVFHDDADYEAFLKAIADLKGRRPFARKRSLNPSLAP